MKNINQIRDFYLAAYLVATGIKLHSHDKVPGGTLFNFSDDRKTQDAIDKYYSMSASIEPMTYGNSIKSLKAIVHSNETKSKTEVNNNVKQYRRLQ